MNLRTPAIAGTFYPGSEDAIRRAAKAYLERAQTPAEPAPIYIAPHAGWMYSGPVAAPVYKALAADGGVRTVAILCPAHRVFTEGMAIPSVDAFETPLGVIPLERELLADLARLPEVHVFDAAHRDEHAIEVHLPFLQEAIGDFSLVPIVVGRASPGAVARVIDRLRAEPGLRILISSDLSHYERYESALRHDLATAERIEHLDARLDGEDACGAYALNGLMTWLESQGGAKVERLALANSGDTAGDRSRVVGYGAWSVHLAERH